MQPRDEFQPNVTGRVFFVPVADRLGGGDRSYRLSSLRELGHGNDGEPPQRWERPASLYVVFAVRLDGIGEGTDCCTSWEVSAPPWSSMFKERGWVAARPFTETLDWLLCGSEEAGRV
jgi:hypothetical protein